MLGTICSLHRSDSHSFSKQLCDSLQLIEGQGVEGDAHLGVTVKHRSRVVRDPSQPNLRQVHLIHSELHEELRTKGLHIEPGDMGENITTQGLELLKLPRDTQLSIGDAVLQVTGLRNPCGQLDTFRKGLQAAVLDHDENGNLIRKAGIMTIVLQGGQIRIGDAIVVTLPPPPHHSLLPV